MSKSSLHAHALILVLLSRSNVAHGVSFGNTAESASPFGDGMILQRGGASVWGLGASSGDLSVLVECSNGQKVQTKAAVSPNGTWYFY